MIRNKKGFGVEDTPFMILAAVAVIMLVTWMGIEAMATFVEGNEYQSAVEASTDIYKRAKLISLGYDGSSDNLKIQIPEGYAIRIDGSVTPLEEDNDTLKAITEPLSIPGVRIDSDEELLEAGKWELFLVYSAEDAKVTVSKK